MSRADLSLTAGFILVVTVSVIQGQNGWTVTYTSNQICALEGSTVDIHCTYTYPSRIKDLDTEVEKTFWFIKLQNEEPVDLRADSQFSGRVQYHCSKNSCTMKITDLRVSDSAVYKFKFISNHPGGRYVGEPGVTLSVTDLKVVSKLSIYSYWAELTCRSSCSLPGHIFYIWYKNEETIVISETYSDYIDSQNSYSCAVRGHEDVPSHPVCVHSESCNKVIYTGRSICAFKGSSVDISCTYTSVGYITSKLWFRSERSRQWQNPSQPEDLSKDSQYSGRFQVFETETGRSTLRITDLRETDSAQYYFKFITWGFEWRSSLPGTTLTVTDPTLQVQVIWSSVGPKLVCHSSCLPPGRSFVWYRNEKKIQGETSPSYSGYVEPADSYSCSIEGPEGYRSLPVCEF
ncbi:hypothetical protein EXN66_Car003706 [Channa argus]|uniref:Ig-like domain-containing protein n=1 Tax=Channa argus TaxID=215402 RepID=A0A6G1PD35_CHAAH|nr:hypothetical protein EXN66_Car003706 [Channa argus]